MGRAMDLIDRVVSGEDAKVVVGGLRESRGKDTEEGKGDLRERAEHFVSEEKEDVMGVVSGALRLIGRVMGGARPKEVIQENTDEDPFLAQSLQIDEDIRTGKNRMLSAEESQRAIDRLKKKWGMS